MTRARNPVATATAGAAWLLFRRAVRPTFVVLRESIVRLIEWRYGIRTHGVVDLTALGLGSAERVNYKPTPWLILRRALPPRSVTADDVFLDLGSGMGRVVFQAARRYPFRRVIGVELSSELNRIARRNLERNRSKWRCRSVHLVHSDVLHYAIPDDVTVVFLGNPFTGSIFQGVVLRLLESLRSAPRALRLIYFNPVEHDRLMATGRAPLVKRIRGMRPGEEWARSNSANVYVLTPEPAP